MILPHLTTVTPSLRKKYDRLPKPNEVFILARMFKLFVLNLLAAINLDIVCICIYIYIVCVGHAALHVRDG